MVPLREDQVLSKQLQHHALLAVKITHEAECPGLIIGLIHHYLGGQWGGRPMTLSQALEGSKDALLPEAPPVGCAGLPLAVEPPSTRRGFPIRHNSRSKAGSSATSWPLARHSLSRTAFTKCPWPCQLGSTDQLRTPDRMMSTGELLWPKTTTPSRTTQAVIYLSWSVEVPRLRVRWDPPFQSLRLRLPNRVGSLILGACRKPAAHDWTAEDGTSNTPPARSRAARTPLTSTPTSLLSARATRPLQQAGLKRPVLNRRRRELVRLRTTPPDRGYAPRRIPPGVLLRDVSQEGDHRRVLNWALVRAASEKGGHSCQDTEDADASTGTPPSARSWSTSCTPASFSPRPGQQTRRRSTRQRALGPWRLRRSHKARPLGEEASFDRTAVAGRGLHQT